MAPSLASVNKLSAIIDLAVGVSFCIIAVRALTVSPITFETVVLGVIEFIVGITVGVVSLIRFPYLDHMAHLMYTYSGRGIVFVFFGVLGLSGDIFRYVFSAITIAVGLLYIIYGCFVRQSPSPCIDCGSYEPSKRAPPDAPETFTGAPKQGTAPPPQRPNPFNAPPTESIVPKAAPAAPQNPFRPQAAEP